MQETQLLEKFKDYLKNNKKIAYPLECIKNGAMVTIRLAVSEGEDRTFIRDLEFYFGIYIEPEIQPKAVVENYIETKREIKIRTIQLSEKTFRIQKRLRSHLRLMNPLKDLLEKRLNKQEEKPGLSPVKPIQKPEKTEVMFDEGSKDIKLKVTKGVDEGTLYPISRDPMFIGRQNPENPQDIKLHDKSISKQHVRIEVIDGSIYIIDLKSTNGTYVNDMLITKQKLKIGDRIFIGQTELEVVVDSASNQDVTDDTVYIKGDVKREEK